MQTLLTRHRRSLAIVGLFVAVGIGTALLLPVEYRAQTEVYPSSLLRSGELSGATSTLAGLSRQLGVGTGTDPSALFPAILGSREQVANLLAGSYPFRDGSQRNLLDYLAGPEGSSAGRADRAYRKFVRGALWITRRPETGVTSIGIVLRDPVASAAVANACAAELDRALRTYQATDQEARARFASERLADCGDSLRAVENRLQAFRERNRSVAGAPRLIFEEERLQREVSVSQTVFLNLKQQFEMARIESAKDIPALTVLEKATVPLVKFRPRRALFVAFFFLLGTVAAATHALARRSALTWERIWKQL